MPPCKIGEEEPQEYRLHLQYWPHTHKHLYASCAPTSPQHRLPAENKNSPSPQPATPESIHPNAAYTAKSFSPFYGCFRRIIPQRIQPHKSPYRKPGHRDQAASPALLTMPTAQRPWASANAPDRLIARNGAFRIPAICMNAIGSQRTS